MPSLEHEALLSLFRNEPELAARLLCGAAGVKLPSYTEVRTASSDLTDVTPAEFRADAGFLLVDRAPVLGLILEVQLQRDDRKRFTWPAYVAVYRARHECPVELLVVTPDPSVARWAASSIFLGLADASVVRPRVLGPEDIPIVTDCEEAAALPELAVLSVMTYGQGDVERAVKIAEAARAGVERLADRELFVLYSDFIEIALSSAAKQALQMIPRGYQYKSELIRNSIAQGRTEGFTEGLSEGRLAQQRASVLDVLSARGLPVTEAARGRVLSCTDVETLARWHRRAVTAASTEAMFDEQ